MPFSNSDNLAFQGNGFALPAVARNNIPGYASIHRPEYANDGFYGNGASWNSHSTGSWLKIDLGRHVLVDRIMLGRDRTGSYNDRDPGQFTIEVALSDAAYANRNNSDGSSEHTLAFDSAAAGLAIPKRASPVIPSAARM